MQTLHPKFPGWRRRRRRTICAQAQPSHLLPETTEDTSPSEMPVSHSTQAPKPLPDDANSNSHLSSKLCENSHTNPKPTTLTDSAEAAAKYSAAAEEQAAAWIQAKAVIEGLQGPEGRAEGLRVWDRTGVGFPRRRSYEAS